MLSLQSLSKSVITAFAAFAVLACTTNPAHGSTLLTFVGEPPGTNAVNISGDGGSSYEGAYSGAYWALDQDKGVRMNIYCTDFHHNISNGESYQANHDFLLTDPAGPLVGQYYQGGLASALVGGDFGPFVPLPQANQRASEIAWLADSFLNVSQNYFSGGASGSTDYFANQTGISVAIWDIAQDGGDGVFTGQGNIVLDGGGQAGYGNLAGYFEGLAAQHNTYKTHDIAWIQAPITNGSHAQDFVGVAAPEPSMLVAALCAVAALLIMGRRKSVSPVA